MLDIIDLWVCYEGEKEQTWGLAPAESIDEKGCSLFKPFYRPRQIFHDVFEHNFEERHPYFTGNHAFQKEGEIAAMGAWYYYGTRLELSRALAFTRNIHDCETVINETLTSWNRNIPLGSCVPPQKEIFDTAKALKEKNKLKRLRTKEQMNNLKSKNNGLKDEDKLLLQ